MGLARVSELQAKLLAAGMPDSMPVAVIAQASCPNQYSISGSLGTLAEDVQRALVASPAIIVVGSVARLASIALPEAEQSRVASG